MMEVGKTEHLFHVPRKEVVHEQMLWEALSAVKLPYLSQVTDALEKFMIPHGFSPSKCINTHQYEAFHAIQRIGSHWQPGEPAW